MANRAAKGGQYERDVCKVLSLWFSRGKRDDIFWRTAGSGARATTRSKNNIDTADSSGDVQAQHESGKKFTSLVNIELKRGYTPKGKNQSSSNHISITNLIDRSTNRRSNPSALVAWYEKGMEECNRHNKKHLLVIYKRDRRKSCIMMPLDTFNMLEENNRTFIHPHDGTLCLISLKSCRLVILPLEDFLGWCHPKAFFKKIVRLKKKLPFEQGKYAGKNILKLKKHDCFPKRFQ